MLRRLNIPRAIALLVFALFAIAALAASNSAKPIDVGILKL
jgi:hypothetical protein